ncbi:MAG TPA: FAD-linked oxidase C-terminal domain-containing protein [Micropepsaceae bacterium]|jgi:glycolate oxidase|nr:FAD-linked oxidase C-terminal domain-containing protein [Micropepsaceae bacterium]
MITLPPPDPATLARRTDIADALRRIVPDGVIGDEATLTAFDCDALTAYRQRPLLCVLPENADQVAGVLAYAGRENIRIVPRGAGTSLSGGALPLADSILLGMSRMSRILEIDYENRCAVVQPGVTNASVTRAVQARGFYYAPDPSSQIACTIGGNVAENSGGIHCLKYGLTTQNLMGVELVLMSGERVRLGGKHAGDGGLDLLSVVCGSEGMLGVVTEATLRILPRPPVTRTLLIAFDSVRQAGETVAAIIAAGIIPAALEFMDRRCIEAVEAFCAPNYPPGAEAILIGEIDGMPAEVADDARRIAEIAASCGATSTRDCADEAERTRVWSGRKAAFGAMGRLEPDMLCMDGTIPRKALAEVLDRISQLSEHYGLVCCNVFHAGDGNLHPLIVFDCMSAGALERAEAFGADILKLCVAMGGVLTGEHGVGVEKKALMGEMFSDIDLAQQERLKCAFDGQGLLNPGKVFPTLHACVELGRMHVQGGRLPFANLPRM